MEDANTSSPKAETLCKVCGDKASGKHYGVASCDGCRGFFKRSIRRNLEYVCKENNKCIVDVTRRNQCQACRFRKCLQVNMKRDAVQHERAPRSASQANLHHYPLGLGSRLGRLHATTFFPGLPLHLQNPPLMDASLSSTGLHAHPYLPNGFLYPGMFGGMTKPAFLSGNLGGSMQFSQKISSPFISTLSTNLSNNRQVIALKDDEVTSSEEPTSSKVEEDDLKQTPTGQQAVAQDNERLELPILNDPLKAGRQFDATLPCLTLFPAENIYESAAKLLFLSIKWARSIPSFLQLSYRDQSILLEESWSELFVLTAAQWSLPIDEAFLVSNAMAPSSRQTELQNDARKLREITNRLSLLRVDHTEHACLKALVLFKAESRGLCEPSHVELLQDQTHVMLHEYCAQKQPVHKGRFGKLLLALPAVQAVSRRSLEELLFRQTVGDVAIDRLLGDLIKVTVN